MASKDALAAAIVAYTGLPPDLARSVAASMTLGQFLTLEQMKRQAATFAQLGVLTKDVSGELGDYYAGDLVAEIQKG